MINLSRQAMRAIAALLSILLLLSLVLSVSALATRGPAPADEAVSATTPPGTDTPAPETPTATDTPTPTPEPPTDTPSQTPAPTDTPTPSSTATSTPLPQVVVFDGANFTGNTRSLGSGNYGAGVLSVPLGNDAIKSLRIPTGWSVVLYRDFIFQLPSPILRQDVADANAITAGVSGLCVRAPGEDPLSCPNMPRPTATPAPVNLLGNPSFEQSPDQVETRWSFDSRESVADGAWSRAAARSGSRSLSIKFNTAPRIGLPNWTSTGTVPIESGKTYTFSAWAYSSDRSNAWLRVNLYDARGNYLVAFGTGCAPLRDANQWRQLAIAVSARDDGAAGATQARLELAVCSLDSGDIGTTVYYDDVFFGVTPP